jgi:opacity protein-like surface antigen
VSVLFVEPRYVVTAGSGLALYVAGRVGAGKLVCDPEEDCAEQSTELAYGGGGGLLLRLSSRLSLDLGSQYFSTQYTVANGDKTRAGYVLARIGLSIGL